MNAFLARVRDDLASAGYRQRDINRIALRLWQSGRD